MEFVAQEERCIHGYHWSYSAVSFMEVPFVSIFMR